MLDQALDRSKAGLIGEQNQRTPGLFVECEAAIRPGQSDRLVKAQLAEDVIGERIAGMRRMWNCKCIALQGQLAMDLLRGASPGIPMLTCWPARKRSV